MTHPYVLRLAIAQRHERYLREADLWRLHRAQRKDRQHTPLQDAYWTLLELGKRSVRWAWHWNPRTPIEQI
jgi:hypothetical protein